MIARLSISLIVSCGTREWIIVQLYTKLSSSANQKWDHARTDILGFQDAHGFISSSDILP